MNREIWLRILTVAVVAPYLFKLSGNERGYFNTGLKLVAGGLVAANVVPLLKDFETIKTQTASFMAQVAAAQETLNKNQRVATTIDVEDGEFVESAV